ncbi:hypothetical protein XA68_10600 [Ophiocordyceps unilateralis]|uniref:Uncharacterized protein n=1 Tax=Ophiocordyceps unilateralis TaxID=268505 RepID=A0A2A9PIC5_OPHUN|nr:hypothetical protein XA68_10600 [Ophiocordyceps unilateralis]
MIHRMTCTGTAGNQAGLPRAGTSSPASTFYPGHDEVACHGLRGWPGSRMGISRGLPCGSSWLANTEPVVSLACPRGDNQLLHHLQGTDGHDDQLRSRRKMSVRQYSTICGIKLRMLPYHGGTLAKDCFMAALRKHLTGNIAPLTYAIPEWSRANAAHGTLQLSLFCDLLSGQQPVRHWCRRRDGHHLAMPVLFGTGSDPTAGSYVGLIFIAKIDPSLKRPGSGLPLFLPPPTAQQGGSL